MLEVYKKMYATLAGCIDKSIDELEDAASQEVCDKQRILGTAGRLRLALLEAEDIVDAVEKWQKGSERK